MNLNLTSTQIHMSRHIKFYFNKENLVNLGCTQTKHLSIPNTIVGSKEVRFRQVFTIQINCKQFISAFSDHIGQLTYSGFSVKDFLIRELICPTCTSADGLTFVFYLHLYFNS
jgi:hypothetical protein